MSSPPTRQPSKTSTPTGSQPPHASSQHPPQYCPPSVPAPFPYTMPWNNLQAYPIAHQQQYTSQEQYQQQPAVVPPKTKTTTTTTKTATKPPRAKIAKSPPSSKTGKPRKPKQQQKVQIKPKRPIIPKDFVPKGMIGRIYEFPKLEKARQALNARIRWFQDHAISSDLPIMTEQMPEVFDDDNSQHWKVSYKDFAHLFPYWKLNNGTNLGKRQIPKCLLLDTQNQDERLVVIHWWRNLSQGVQADYSVSTVDGIQLYYRAPNRSASPFQWAQQNGITHVLDLTVEKERSKQRGEYYKAHWEPKPKKTNSEKEKEETNTNELKNCKNPDHNDNGSDDDQETKDDTPKSPAAAVSEKQYESDTNEKGEEEEGEAKTEANDRDSENDQKDDESITNINAHIANNSDNITPLHPQINPRSTAAWNAKKPMTLKERLTRKSALDPFPGYRSMTCARDIMKRLDLTVDQLYCTRTVAPITICSIEGCRYPALEQNRGFCALHKRNWWPQNFLTFGVKRRGHFLLGLEYVIRRSIQDAYPFAKTTKRTQTLAASCNCKNKICEGIGWSVEMAKVPKEYVTDHLLSEDLVSQEDQEKLRIIRLAPWHFPPSLRTQMQDGSWRLNFPETTTNNTNLKNASGEGTEGNATTDRSDYYFPAPDYDPADFLKEEAMIAYQKRKSMWLMPDWVRDMQAVEEGPMSLEEYQGLELWNQKQHLERVVAQSEHRKKELSKEKTQADTKIEHMKKNYIHKRKLGNLMQARKRKKMEESVEEEEEDHEDDHDEHENDDRRDYHGEEVYGGGAAQGMLMRTSASSSSRRSYSITDSFLGGSLEYRHGSFVMEEQHPQQHAMGGLPSIRGLFPHFTATAATDSRSYNYMSQQHQQQQQQQPSRVPYYSSTLQEQGLSQHLEPGQSIRTSINQEPSIRHPWSSILNGFR